MNELPEFHLSDESLDLMNGSDLLALYMTRHELCEDCRQTLEHYIARDRRLFFRRCAS
jgi:hypothetical protein